MFYLIYETVNLITGQRYIGAHKTTNLDDGYIGSGKVLKRAIKKYGITAFSRTILCECDTAKEMYEMESKLVSVSWIADPNTYNIRLGGNGGWDHIDHQKIDKLGNGRKGALVLAQRRAADPEVDAKFRASLSDAAKRRWERDGFRDSKSNPGFSGKRHTDDTKRLMSQAKKGKCTGSENAQHGTRWITDGMISKKISREANIPDGWWYGRAIR